MVDLIRPPPSLGPLFFSSFSLFYFFLFMYEFVLLSLISPLLFINLDYSCPFMFMVDSLFSFLYMPFLQ